MPNAEGQLKREDFKAPEGQFRVIRQSGLNGPYSIFGDFTDWESTRLALNSARATHPEYGFNLYDESGPTNEHIRLTKPQRTLKFLREGSPTSLHWIAELREELSKANQSLVDIQSDEEELRRFEVKICRKAVREAYEDLCRRPGSRQNYETIVEMARIGGFKVWEETGKTDKELRSYAWLRD